MFGFIKKLLGFSSNEEIISKIQNGAMLIDVRSPEEYDRGHIKSSINIPVNRIENSITQLEGKENIIVFCQSGGRSKIAQSILKKNKIHASNGGGIDNVKTCIDDAFNNF